jgi:hypothetical protein
MGTTLKRSLEVDFFRGVAMIVIVLDHIAGSAVSRITLHNYAYCDAAEVFVYLGGYATAAAFTAIAARDSQRAAALRLARRAWEIYRAYLVTAALMVAIGAAMLLFHFETPMRAITEAPQLDARPFSGVFDILTLQRQPYLSSVLPMYMLFALSAPLTVPLVQKSPLAAVAASVAIWLAAPALGRMLPSVYPDGWAFNPFAWQLMFMGGMFCRLRPLSNAFQASRTGVWLTRGAWTLALAFAFAKFLETQPTAGILKQNLAPVRIASFWALAWLFAQWVRMGRIKPLAQALPWIVTVGQQGLPCFVTGSAISLIVDTVLRAAAPHGPSIWMGLIGDFFAAGSMLLAAHIARWLKTRRATPPRHAVAQPSRRTAMRAFVELLVQRGR